MRKPDTAEAKQPVLLIRRERAQRFSGCAKRSENSRPTNRANIFKAANAAEILSQQNEGGNLQ
jgi:hypothetical protein